jgi:C1q domain
MSGVGFGSPVSSTNTNNSLLAKNGDDTAVGKITLANTDPLSGVQVDSIQKSINELDSFTGAPANGTQNQLPGWTNNDVGSSTNNLKQRADALTERFNNVTGHNHSGLSGDAPPIPSQNVTYVPLVARIIQATDIPTLTNGSSSVDVSALMTGNTPSTGDAVKGWPVNTPYNKVLLREADGTLITHGGGGPNAEEIYGRLTESSGTWTITFYFIHYSTGVETATTMPATYTNAKWYSQILINPITDTGYTYDSGLFVPSTDAVADIPDATPTQSGKVSTGVQSFGGNKSFTGTIDASNLSGTNTGDASIGPVGSTPNANAGVFTGQVLNLQPANATNPGLISTSAQSIAGKKTLVDGEIIQKILQLSETIDSSTTGTNAVLSVVNPYIALTNTSLLSIGSIASPSAGQTLIIINRTTAAIMIKNNSTGTAAERILTGTGADLSLGIDASLLLVYDTNASRWQIVGGSGSGGGVTLDTMANIIALPRVAGNLYYATDEFQFFADNGTSLVPFDTVVDTFTNLDNNYTLFEGKTYYATDEGRLYTSDGSNLIPVGPLMEDPKNAGNVGEVIVQDSTILAKFKQPFFERSYYLKKANLSSNSQSNASLYANGTAVPTTGSGGSPSMTIAPSSTNPINAPYASPTNYNLRLTAGALGDGYRELTEDISREDYGKMFKVVVNYNVVSGTYTDGDLGVYILDSANSLVTMQPTNLLAKPVGMGRMEFIFQMPVQAVATALQTLKVCMHQHTSNTGYVVDFTWKIVEEMTQGYAPIQTNWKSLGLTTSDFTGMGTVSGIEIDYKQDGQDLLIHGYFVTGTVSNVTAKIKLPFKMDTSLYTVKTIVGRMPRSTGSAAGEYFANLILDPADPDYIYFSTGNNGYTPDVVKTGTDLFNNSEKQWIEFARIPIQGWSSQTLVASEYDGRVVAASYWNSANYATNTDEAINYDTKIYDTHNCVTTGSANTWRFTCKVAGLYCVNIVGETASGSCNPTLVKNGSRYSYFANFASGSSGLNGSITLELAVGDTIYVAPDSSITAYGGGTKVTRVDINKLSGSQQIVVPNATGLPVGSATLNAASSATISNLNGNVDKVWKIVMKGKWTGADGELMGMRPNNDSTASHYYGTSYTPYDAGQVATVWAAGTYAQIGYHAYTQDVSWISEITFYCDTTGNYRPIKSQAGYISAHPNGGDGAYSGGWTDTTNNVTSLTFIFGSGTFTGTINVYQDKI